MNISNTRSKILLSATSVIILLLAGTAIFNSIEKWSVVDSFYFTGVTLTTIGFGDFVPTTDISKIITVVFSFFGIGIVFSFFYIIAEHYTREKEKRVVALIKKYNEKGNKKTLTEIRKEILEGTD
jgi:voltage-gated potassium channel Kch